MAPRMRGDAESQRSRRDGPRAASRLPQRRRPLLAPQTPAARLLGGAGAVPTHHGRHQRGGHRPTTSAPHAPRCHLAGSAGATARAEHEGVLRLGCLSGRITRVNMHDGAGHSVESAVLHRSACMAVSVQEVRRVEDTVRSAAPCKYTVNGCIVLLLADGTLVVTPQPQNKRPRSQTKQRRRHLPSALPLAMSGMRA